MDLDGLLRRAIVLVAYEGDDYWHERVVLGFCGKKGLVVCTPHWDVYVEQIDDYASLQLLGPRGGRIPPAVLRTGRVVRFDHAELQEKWDDLLAQAVRGAPDMREEAAEEVEKPKVKGDTIWVAMEARHGVVLGAPLDKAWKVEQFGDRAVAVKGALSLSVAKTDTWKAPGPGAPKASAHDDDLRTLSITYDGRGERSREWGTSVLEITETTFEDWPLEGPRTCLWLLAAIRRQGFTPMSRHSWWRASLGLCITDPGVEDHALLSDLFESALWYDGLNLGELLCFEKLARRYQLWEEFHKDSLRRSMAKTDHSSHLDGEERELFMGERFSRNTALVSPSLQSHIAEKLKERAAIQKERRKAQEERTLQSPSQARVEGPQPKRRGKKGGGAEEG